MCLAHDGAESQQETAMRELASLGFTELQVGQGKLIVVETLNKPQMRAFQKHYEGALAEALLNCLDP